MRDDGIITQNRKGVLRGDRRVRPAGVAVRRDPVHQPELSTPGDQLDRRCNIARMQDRFAQIAKLPATLPEEGVAPPFRRILRFVRSVCDDLEIEMIIASSVDHRRSSNRRRAKHAVPPRPCATNWPCLSPRGRVLPDRQAANPTDSPIHATQPSRSSHRYGRRLASRRTSTRRAISDSIPPPKQAATRSSSRVSARSTDSLRSVVPDVRDRAYRTFHRSARIPPGLPSRN
jgi:hypothetical protein